MDRIKACLVISLIVIGVLGSTAQADNLSTQSPVGYWRTIDNTTGKPKTIIKIWQTEDRTLKGKVVKIFSENLDHKQPNVGTVILTGLKSSHRHWSNGKILDSENGKTYDCYAKLADNGRRLNVKGYIGLPLLGHSQTWERIDLMSGRVR
jgi:uncharacterized protein (DUF2147 family)